MIKGLILIIALAVLVIVAIIVFSMVIGMEGVIRRERREPTKDEWKH